VTRNLALYAAGLPTTPLDAARVFHEQQLPTVRSAIAAAKDRAPTKPESLLAVTILFESGDRTHDAWRLAAVQGLAREAAPVRVNGVVGDDERAIKEMLEYLADAPGVTGQILAT
jgi:hypothetical protein